MTTSKLTTASMLFPELHEVLNESVDTYACPHELGPADLNEVSSDDATKFHAPANCLF